ncbi:MAG: hypothetical protein IT211_14525 [Armatimonadetes bacterium]|nr:hypothetical protein [Armatimonadota bacterium]
MMCFSLVRFPRITQSVSGIANDYNERGRMQQPIIPALFLADEGWGAKINTFARNQQEFLVAEE